MYPTKEHNGRGPPGTGIGSIATRHPPNSRFTQTPAEFRDAVRRAATDPGYEPSPDVRQAIINAIQTQYTARGEDAEFIELQKTKNGWIAMICAATCALVPLLVATGLALTRGGTRRRRRQRHRRTRRLRSNRLKPAF